ncbi:DNA helicase, putative [Babesia ovata]|uniref:DNA helicase, putative n=1 Tax=Babesia ovata TaxID=189622 RepID=A0A2H6KEB9_9APIC|nr:DNA helicase, putative [Babesia ovata]GBE61336.1 DNA helicase, putative [Babesia ovata]
MSEPSDLKARLVELRDQLRSISSTYSALCLYLREVDTLSALVASDYYELQRPSEEMTRRLEKWRSLERRIFYALDRHSRTNFESYRKTEAQFIKRIGASGEPKPVKRDTGIRLKVHRFKEGVIAMKYATEARRRATNIADFIVEVKKITGREVTDHYDNLIILQALTEWTKDVIRDCVRCTASSADKFTNEESNGQIVYTNDVIRNILEFCQKYTTVDGSAKKPIGTRLVEYMLDRSPEPRKDAAGATGGVDSSYITYYLFNLQRDLDSGHPVAVRRLEQFRNACKKQDVVLSIPRPIHVYQLHEYFYNYAKSSNFVKLIHSAQQTVLQTVSATFAADLLRRIMALLEEGDFAKLNNVSILTAIRAAKFLTNPDDKKLLGIWSSPPFLK